MSNYAPPEDLEPDELLDELQVLEPVRQMYYEEQARFETLFEACNQQVGVAFKEAYPTTGHMIRDMLDDVFDIWFEKYVLGNDL